MLSGAPMTTTTTLACACLVSGLLATSSGCAGTLPEVVFANQVDAYFPDTELDADTSGADAEGETGAHALHLEAGHCAARLNGHRSTAETVSVIQGILSGIGGATGGVGGALAVVPLDDPDINTAMGVMGSIGAAITVVGNLILGFVANPLEELRLHAQAERSWELAIELELAHGDAEAIRASLARCVADEAPPTHVAGEGEPYSE